MKRLEGKVAIVTGASSGIGFATAKLFAHEGAKLVVGARRESELKKLVEAVSSEGGEAIALAGDVQSEEYAKALVVAAVDRFGRLNIAVNNAGTSARPGRPRASLKRVGPRPWQSISPAPSLAPSTRLRRC